MYEGKYVHNSENIILTDEIILYKSLTLIWSYNFTSSERIFTVWCATDVTQRWKKLRREFPYNLIVIKHSSNWISHEYFSVSLYDIGESRLQVVHSFRVP